MIAASAAFVFSCDRSESLRSEESVATPQGASVVAEAETEDIAAPAAAGEASSVVAVVRGEPVTAEELDALIRLRLHDLERARYELRRQHLESLLLTKLLGAEAAEAGLPIQEYLDREAARAASDVAAAASAEPASPARRRVRREAFARRILEEANAEILLAEPVPPVIDVATEGRPVRGDSRAPIAIVGFLDFESSHCRRMQPVLEGVLSDYDGLVRLVARDLPMPFHRHAREAALAAHCAAEQGAYWRYHDLLLLNQDDLSHAALIRHAESAGLDSGRFTACFDAEKGAELIDADVAAARRLGLSVVPTFFVNGLYLKGPQSYESLRRWIEREIERLGLERDPFRTAGLSSLPLTLVGTLLQQPPEASLAAIRRDGEEHAHQFTVGDEVLEGVDLVRVERERAYVRHDGRIELLRLAGSTTGDEAEAVEAWIERATAPPDIVLALDRAEVDAALRHRRRLERALSEGQLDVEGKRLLKLSEVEPGSLYEKLGLRPKDVLMQVNGEWVHDRKNPLWEALRERSEVDVVVMRGGFPKRFRYRIEK